MNKKTVILLVILILLVLVTLNRWDVSKWEISNTQIVNLQADRLTTGVKLVAFTKSKAHEPFAYYQNEVLIHIATAFLYSAIAATTIALLLEARKKE